MTELKCIACLGPMGYQPWSDGFCRDCAVIRGEAPPIQQCEKHCWFLLRSPFSKTALDAALRALLDEIWKDVPVSERSVYFMDIPPAPVFKGTGRGNLFQVARSIDILNFASDFTTLRAAGPGRYRGQCPVHPFPERSGSFYIFTAKNTWRCFGACAEGGDIIKLAQRLMDRGIAV